MTNEQTDKRFQAAHYCCSALPGEMLVTVKRFSVMEWAHR